MTGEAAEAIQDLEVTSESYDLSWEILDARFNNRRKLLESIIGAVIVKQLKCTAEEIIVEIFLPKFDNKTRGRFEDFVGHTTDTPSSKKVSEFLQREKDMWLKFAPTSQKNKL